MNELEEVEITHTPTLPRVPLLKVIPKEEWGSPKLYDRVPFRYPLMYVVMTLSTNTEPCSSLEECSKILLRLQDIDINKNELLNIRYNFLLGSDGNIYEGRGWKAIPAITGTFAALKGKYLHIACIGNFRDKVRPDAMYKAQWDLVQYGVDRGFLKREFVFV